MSLPLIIRPSAQAELEEAVEWYERQRSGLGDAFTDAVQDVLDEIAAHPRRYPKEYLEVRGAPVDGFPHWVYYRDEGSRVVVISVFHPSRDPSVWQSRA